MNSPASCPGTGRPLRPQHRLPDPPSPFNTQSTTRPPAPARSASRVTIRHAMSASGHAYGEADGVAAPYSPAGLDVTVVGAGSRRSTPRAILAPACQHLWPVTDHGP